ncbi:hypothetical protein ACFSW8_01865 [Rubritalea tangerina]|uniref:Cation efflux protein cytoplasmic domain-containing protein n=2 Tax=Rubritalea tangerina TaxID=430798 RepID=A0ABW4Z6Q3_9BACT
MKVSLAYFLQQSPRGFDLDSFTRRLLAIEGVLSAHHTHCWTLEGEHHVFSTHIVMDRRSSRSEIYQAKIRIRDLLAGGSFEHITIDVELEGEQCLLDCEEK